MLLLSNVCVQHFELGTTWHGTASKHDIFRQSFGIRKGSTEKVHRVHTMHTYALTELLSKSINAHTLPETSHISTSVAQRKKPKRIVLMDYDIAEKWEHSCSNLLQLHFIVSFQTISGTTAVHYLPAKSLFYFMYFFCREQNVTYTTRKTCNMLRLLMFLMILFFSVFFLMNWSWELHLHVEVFIEWHYWVMFEASSVFPNLVQL